MAADGRAEFDPKEIASAAFPTAFRGYDQEAVRQYLTRLAAAVGRAQQLGILGAIDHDEGSAYLRAAEAEREAAELRARVVELEALVESSFDAATDPAADVADAADWADSTADDGAGGDRVDGDPEQMAADVDGRGDDHRSTALDEAELIEQLGLETAKILETARAAAANITKRAEDEAAQIERDAAQDARNVRDEAENALAAARIEAKRITTAASDEAAQIQQRLEAEAQRAYDDARDEADRIVTDAATKVERDLAAARQRAEQIVADAEGVREEVLGDLVRRRRVHRSQLSRLTDARDRLARSLAAARSDLDEVATTIDVATGSASIDLTEPEPASEALDSDVVAELLARLDRARAEAAPVVETSSAETSSAETSSAETSSVVTSGVVTSGVERRNGEFSNGAHAAAGAHGSTDDDTVQLRAGSDHANGGVGRPGAGSEVDNGVLVLDAETSTVEPIDRVDLGSPGDRGDEPGSGDGGTHLVADGSSSTALPADGVTVDDSAADEPALDDRPSSGAVPDPAFDDVAGDEAALDVGDDEVAGETESAQSYRAQAAQAIDELNGPIDGDRLLDQLGFTDDRVLGTDGGVIARNESRGDLPRNAPYAGRPPELFEQRDVAMTKATPGFRRRLKRAVNDDQSDVLDRLRAGRKEISVDELPPLEDQLTGYIAALTPALRDVVVAGARVLGCDDAPLPAVDNLCLQLAKHIVDNLRLATIDVIEASPDADREAILDPVRAIYRDFRNTLLPDLIDDALHEAFALGIYHAIDPDSDVLWVVDPRLDADPICEDNSASPPLPKGTEFPSGHARPLSMPGCRCLAVPAR